MSLASDILYLKKHVYLILPIPSQPALNTRGNSLGCQSDQTKLRFVMRWILGSRGAKFESVDGTKVGDISTRDLSISINMLNLVFQED